MTTRRLNGVSRKCFSTATATNNQFAKPNTSINLARHWKGVLLGGMGVMLVSDVVYEVTFLGSLVRAIAESPTKWLNPKNVGVALDEALSSSETVQKPYLADKQQHLRGRPTLCVNLNGCLVATMYDSAAMRWVTYKRPGLDLFLERMSDKYELVLWSSYGWDNALDMMSRLDPQQRYFHETMSTEVERPGTKKDLQYLGRPVQRIIVMDTKPNDQEKYANNTIVIPEWTGSVEKMAQDRTLYNILPFIEHLGTQQKVFDLPRLVAAYQELGRREGKAAPLAYLDRLEEAHRKPATTLLDKLKFWEQ
uniref:Mitochondrial import inner membrane translocase subunit TIM50 n=1 Tax=Eutreptiella gymnastica TaxID=73025 RepID=A0A7S1I7B2_9EUGL|mmetsp:Transcript_136011/g.235950  ORF Transcript_136011/g.235950 Transcript_136011/m.235950 type:complete len:307 (+) Transcript_136011:3-923(+)